MKRLTLILASILSAAVMFASLRRETRAAWVSASGLQQHASSATNELARIESERFELRRVVARQKNRRTQSLPSIQFDPKVTDWLLAGRHANIPPELISPLRVALGLPWDESSDYVLVSKTTLPKLTMSAVRHDDKLSDTLSAVLALAPEEQQQVERALATAHEEFGSWAKVHVQREEPSGETLARYTIPAAGELSQTMINSLLSDLTRVLGPERTGFLENYAYDWLREDMGFLGAVTNTLSVYSRSDGGGKPELHWEVARSSSTAYGQTAESGLIQYHSLPAIFRSIFPGGWREISEREGFKLPAPSEAQPDNP